MSSRPPFIFVCTSISIWTIVVCLLVAGSTVSAQTRTDEGLGVRFTSVAQQAGLNISTIYGDERRNRYLLETTGSGAAFIDYDNDGWEDIFLVNGTRLDGVAGGRQPTNRLYRNNGDGTFAEVTAKAGLTRSNWGQ